MCKRCPFLIAAKVKCVKGIHSIYVRLYKFERIQHVICICNTIICFDFGVFVGEEIQRTGTSKTRNFVSELSDVCARDREKLRKKIEFVRDFSVIPNERES